MSSSAVSNAVQWADLRQCQHELHRWGHGNRVTFDAAKEHFCIVSQTQPEGESMRLLGVVFDPQLSMAECVGECVHEASWRLKTVMRTRRYHTDSQLLQHFKTHVLSYLEYRTPGLYHAASTTLEPLDPVLRSFLRDINICLEDALLHFNLGPLETRRVIAMLDVVHRVVLLQGPAEFFEWFKVDTAPRRGQRGGRNKSRKLVVCAELTCNCVARHSAFGLCTICSQSGLSASLP